MNVGVAGVDRREDPVGLPDRPELPHRPDQVRERQRAPGGEEAADARVRIDQWVDTHQEWDDLALLLPSETPHGACHHARDDRAFLLALRVDEGEQDDPPS